MLSPIRVDHESLLTCAALGDRLQRGAEIRQYLPRAKDAVLAPAKDKPEIFRLGMGGTARDQRRRTLRAVGIQATPIWGFGEE